MRIIAAALAALTFATTASAQGFDWGGDCDAGQGTFVQDVPYRAIESVGVIPEGKKDVEILLDSSVDVDVQLIDVETGTELIAWPNGLLAGSTEACSNFEGLSFCYSGYNGTGGQLGNEWIRINGATTRDVEMRVYGYEAGDAQVSYRFNPVNTCNEKGDGAFTQYIPYYATTTVGDIPVGKTNVSIELDAAGGADVDVQLWDGNTPIVAWPNGLISTSSESSVEYGGMTITYSGYNGIAGNWGHERIEISGVVSSNLTMKAFGYQSGTAEVTYDWGVGVGATCGGIAALQCDEALECKEWQEGVADAAGVCHTQQWCGSDETAPVDCQNVPHIMTVGSWTCSDTFECEWTTGPIDVCEVGPDATYVAEDTDTCAVIRYTCEPGQIGFSNECGCGCDCPDTLNCMPSPDGTNQACADLDAFEATCPNTQVVF